MEHQELKEYLDSKKYFIDARNWYNSKHLFPVSHRIWVSYIFVLVVTLLAALFINIEQLFPIKQRVTYPINVFSNLEEGEVYAKILDIPSRFNDVNGPAKFIATEMIKNYILKREKFDYSNLSEQIKYVQTSSTRLVFRRFYNFMSANNPDSPLLRYQKFAKREINLRSIKFLSKDEAEVKFVSRAKGRNGAEFENLLWKATIRFSMSEVGKKMPTGTRFRFLVTDYRLKLEKDLA